MKPTFLILIVIFFPLLTFSQSYEYKGVLVLPDSTEFSYYVSFSVLENDSIQGYSITDVYGEHYTKSKISGYINYSTRRISFFESEIYYTRSTAQLEDFCFVHVSNVTYRLFQRKSIIEGNFKAVYKNNKECVTGTIKLTGNTHAQKNPPSFVVPEVLEHQDLYVYRELDEETVTVLLSGDTAKTVWLDESIIMEVWDSEIVDYDMISIYVNGQIFLSRYVLTDRKQVIQIPFTTDVLGIKIVAINEGTIPPNSASILLRDRNKRYQLISHIPAGKEVVLLFEKQTK